MSLYEPPFLIPSQPRVVQKALTIGRRYGAADAANAEPPESDTATLETIEAYAPTVAKLVAGLSPEESVAVLKARIVNLQQYKNIPVIGLYVNGKIGEYSAQIPVLENQAQQARIQRMALTVAYVVGSIAVTGLAFAAWSYGYRQLKETK